MAKCNQLTLLPFKGLTEALPARQEPDLPQLFLTGRAYKEDRGGLPCVHHHGSFCNRRFSVSGSHIHSTLYTVTVSFATVTLHQVNIHSDKLLREVFSARS